MAKVKAQKAHKAPAEHGHPEHVHHAEHPKHVKVRLARDYWPASAASLAPGADRHRAGDVAELPADEANAVIEAGAGEAV
jgi:hypothetical protein